MKRLGVAALFAALLFVVASDAEGGPDYRWSGWGRDLPPVGGCVLRLPSVGLVPLCRDVPAVLHGVLRESEW